MIQKYTYGTPFETDAIVTLSRLLRELLHTELSPQRTASLLLMTWMTTMLSHGLGESNCGINKRGYVYESNCSDQPNHTEDKNLPLRSTQLHRNLRKTDFRSLR